MGTGLSFLTFRTVKACNKTALLTFHAAQILPSVYLGVISVLNKEVFGNTPFKNTIFFDGANEWVSLRGFFNSRVGSFSISQPPISNLEELNGEKVRGGVQDKEVAPVHDKKVLPIKISILHAATRLAFAVETVAAVASRVADGIGSIAAVALVICLGRSHTLNKIALENLAAFGTIYAVSVGVRGFVNPLQAKLKHRYDGKTGNKNNVVCSKNEKGLSNTLKRSKRFKCVA